MILTVWHDCVIAGCFSQPSGGGDGARCCRHDATPLATMNDADIIIDQLRGATRRHYYYEIRYDAAPGAHMAFRRPPQYVSKAC